MMNFSFQEKSLWVLLLGMLAVFGGYFAQVLPAASKNVQPEQIALFVAAVVALVVIQVFGHILIAVIDRRSETDERDRWISLKGTRNASYVLAVGAFFALCAAIMTEGNFIFVHVLFGFWVLAQLVEIGSCLVLYRRGA
jgi:cytochrome b subunit of formate dehydrogenase